VSVNCSSLPSVLCLIESELRSIFLPLRFKPARQTRRVRWRKRKAKQRKEKLQRHGTVGPGDVVDNLREQVADLQSLGMGR
jgi:hypothetical protein